MPRGGSAAKRYAEALLELAEAQGQAGSLAASLDRTTEALSGEALRLLAAPAFPLEARRTALELAAADGPPLVRGLLATLLERDRIGLLAAMVRAYHDLLDARAGIQKAVLTTAVALDEGQRRALVERLERETGNRLRASFAEDPSLIGGLVIRIGDHQVDGSVRTRLALLREQLASG